jgi:hypothetical protein
LFQSAENILRFWKTVLPAPAALERLVATVAASGREEILERIAIRLTPLLQEAIDRALEVPAEKAQSTLFQLKEYPPEATPASIRDFIDRLARLRSMGVSDIDLDGFSPQLINHLAQMARKYDVQALKRFAPSGRYAMVACLMVDAHKTILDHVVTMHDQFLTGFAGAATPLKSVSASFDAVPSRAWTPCWRPWIFSSILAWQAPTRS